MQVVFILKLPQGKILLMLGLVVQLQNWTQLNYSTWTTSKLESKVEHVLVAEVQWTT